MSDTSRARTSPDDDPFYVGYLALPRAHRRWLRVAVPLILWAMVFAGLGMLWAQRAPGGGTWETGRPITREGVLVASPYPLLLEDAGRVTMLTEMGKRGTRERAEAFAGARVRVEGYRIERDGREIIELAPGGDAVVRVEEGGSLSAGIALDGARPITLRGEILDAKCYLGAMRPGDGLAHRACAMLCIRGGIPAMLYSARADGTPAYHLLLDAAGMPVDENVIARAGVPVVVHGRETRVGDLSVLLIDRVE